jgi:hypothetical protein
MNNAGMDMFLQPNMGCRVHKIRIIRIPACTDNQASTMAMMRHSSIRILADIKAIHHHFLAGPRICHRKSYSWQARHLKALSHQAEAHLGAQVQLCLGINININLSRLARPLRNRCHITRSTLPGHNLNPLDIDPNLPTITMQLQHISPIIQQHTNRHNNNLRGTQP